MPWPLPPLREPWLPSRNNLVEAEQFAIEERIGLVILVGRRNEGESQKAGDKPSKILYEYHCANACRRASSLLGVPVRMGGMHPSGRRNMPSSFPVVSSPSFHVSVV